MTTNATKLARLQQICRAMFSGSLPMNYMKVAQLGRRARFGQKLNVAFRISSTKRGSLGKLTIYSYKEPAEAKAHFDRMAAAGFKAAFV